MIATIITQEDKEFKTMAIDPDLWLRLFDKDGKTSGYNLKYYSLKIDQATGDITLDGRHEGS